MLGPFHMTAFPQREHGDHLGHPDGGSCVVSGRVLSTNGKPLAAGAVVGMCQYDEDGFYDVQQPGTEPPGTGSGLFRADVSPQTAASGSGP